MDNVVQPKVPVVWKTNQSEADRLLGKKARPVLDEVIDLMQQVAKDREWPLQQIEISYLQDLEIPDWETLSVTPVFKTTANEADKYLAGFMDEIGVFQARLGKLKREKFIDRVWFDCETV